MKKLILSLSVLFTVLQPLFSQTFQWASGNTHNISLNPDFIEFPSTTDGAGNFILGSIHNFKIAYSTTFFGDVIFKKFSSGGTLLFSNIITGKAVIDGIDADAGSNIYIFGRFLDTLVLSPGNFLLNTGSGFNINHFLLKYNSSGSLVWKKNFNVQYGNDAAVGCIRVKGNNIFAGIVTSAQDFVKKIDLNGLETLSITQSNVVTLSGVDADGQGNILAAGSCSFGNIQFGGLNANAPNSYNLYFVKYNSSGTGQWVKFVQDVTFERPLIVSDASGNLYVSGHLSGSFMFGNLQSQGPQWVYDFYLAKMDPSGTFLWLKEVPNTPILTGDATIGKNNFLRTDNNGNLYLTGFQRGTINWGGVTTTATGFIDVLVLKYSPGGSILWGKASGGSNEQRGDAISLDNQGNIFLSGNFAISVQFDTITVNGAGFVNSFAAKLSNPPVAGIINSNNIPAAFELYNFPNPFNPVTNINYELPITNYVKLVIYNTLGKEIAVIVNQKQNTGRYRIQWDASNYSSGVYFYRLTAGDFSMTSKMMLIK